MGSNVSTSQEDADSRCEQQSGVSTSGQQQEQGAILVGTVELSFAASTRARYLTLNAPVVSFCGPWMVRFPGARAGVGEYIKQHDMVEFPSALTVSTICDLDMLANM